VPQDREARPLDVQHNASLEWEAHWRARAEPPLASLNVREIPHRLHQTYASCQLGARQQAWQVSCGTHNPNWELLLWTDEANRALVARDFPAFLETYDAYDVTIKRVDAIRYMLL